MNTNSPLQTTGTVTIANRDLRQTERTLSNGGFKSAQDLKQALLDWAMAKQTVLEAYRVNYLGRSDAQSWQDAERCEQQIAGYGNLIERLEHTPCS